MATTEQKKFKKKKLFKVARELNVSTDRVVEFLEEEGFSDALSGNGFNASIVDEEAYLVLRQEYADDAEAAERVRELREDKASDEDEVARDEVATLDGDESDEATDVAEASEEAEEEVVAEAAAESEASSEPEAEAEADTTAEASAAEEVDEAPAAEEDVESEALAETADEAVDAQPEEEPAAADAASEPEAEATKEPQEEAKAEPVAEAEDEPVAEAEAPEEQPVEAEADVDAVDESDAEAEATADVEAAEPEATAEAEADESVDDPEAEAEVEAEVEVEAEAATDDTDGQAEASEDVSAEAAEAEAEEAEASAESDDADATASEEDEIDPNAAPTTDTAAEARAEIADADAEDVESVEAKEGAENKSETLKADRYRLSGTQVVGKVDLTQIQSRKRKRKRKKKSKDDSDSKKKQQSRKDRNKKRQKKKKKKRKKRSRNRGVDEEDVEQTIQETLQELEQGASRARQRRRRRRRQRHEEEREERRRRKKEQEGILRLTEFVTTGELANLMGEPVGDVISTLFDAGMMVSINQRLDRETIEFVAAEYELEVEFIDEFGDQAIAIEDDDPEDLEPRAPVVTVMGHVDHGKTSLLDYIRSANVVAGEEGGITQHIGAHRVRLPDHEDEAITFLDTPGHEAFTAMRARGAKATDIVVLVVAADDSVMPQTIEAINHAQAADVPIVVAINKMDKREADPQKVMAELAEHNVLVEEYGGTVQVAKVSAETGEGIDDLLDKIILQSEIMEVTANPDRDASGVIIESRLEKGRGNVITVLVQRGTLEVGDPFVAGIYSGSVRAMFDERDNRVSEAGPSTPVLVLGCDGSPEVGDQFVALEDESEAREIANERQRIHREQELRRKSQVSLDQISRRMAEGEFHELNLIVKADVGGSVEALSDALLKLKTDEVAVRIIHSGVGAITESDVMLARASDAVILGFQVRPTRGARQAAEQEEVDIRTYSIIYDAIEDVHAALEGLLSPEEREEIKGHAEVRDIFKVPNVGTVGGSYVTDGTISRNHRIRVVREGVVTYEGRIGSLKRFKEDVKEVKSGFECGISVENFNDIKVGDELESYVVVEEKRTLEV
ncbi:translation initiation factor IF-2 [Longibacter salinarum]|uniref:Translation initiation factor IF-2 n=1 Tax=Longibacter salinarum TaxID=1850348 RepID=A0A2A8D2Q2_9BACT|nr:translation initiation factor IF-2 [Longibacter salinarum]PEN15097.1 translation initiation factor IF-2 [Longibacter salinarum]